MNKDSKSHFQLSVLLGFISFGFLLAVIFSFPAYTDTDTENLIVYFRNLLDGHKIPIDGLTGAQVLPSVFNYYIYEYLGGIRSIQIVAAAVFSVSMGILFAVTDMLTGRICAILFWIGLLTSYKNLKIVMWGRSPVWALLFVSIGLLVFYSYNSREQKSPKVKLLSERSAHFGLLFSTLAVFCRSDLVSMHAVLLVAAIICFAIHRQWKVVLRMLPWCLVCLTPFLIGLVFFGEIMSIPLLLERYVDIQTTLVPLGGGAQWKRGLYGILKLFNNGMHDFGSILYPVSYFFGWIGIVSLCRKRKISIYLLFFVFVAITLAAIPSAWYGIFSPRLLFLLRIMVLYLCAVGLQVSFSIFKTKRVRSICVMVFVACMLYANRKFYTDGCKSISNGAENYQKHVEMAELIKKHPSLTDTPIVVQHKYCGYIFRNRLHRSYTNVFSEYEFVYRKEKGLSLPEKWTYVRATTNSLIFRYYNHLVPSTTLIEHKDLLWLSD